MADRLRRRSARLEGHDRLTGAAPVVVGGPRPVVEDAQGVTRTAGDEAGVGVDGVTLALGLAATDGLPPKPLRSSRAGPERCRRPTASRSTPVAHAFDVGAQRCAARRRGRGSHGRRGYGSSTTVSPSAASRRAPARRPPARRAPAPARPTAAPRRAPPRDGPRGGRRRPCAVSSPTKPSRLSNTFSVTMAVPSDDREQRHRHRHEVGGEAGVRQRGDVDRARRRFSARAQNPVGGRRHLQPHLGELHHDASPRGRAGRPRA